jgi:hypothetical protein
MARIRNPKICTTDCPFIERHVGKTVVPIKLAYSSRRLTILLSKRSSLSLFPVGLSLPVHLVHVLLSDLQGQGPNGSSRINHGAFYHVLGGSG